MASAAGYGPIRCAARAHLVQNPRSTIWKVLVVLAFASVLTWQYAPKLRMLTDPNLHPLAKLVTVVGAAGALYFWWFFFGRQAPWLLLENRINSAWAKEDWPAVASRIELATNLGRGSEALTASLGTAYTKLKRWQDALDTFAKVHGPLDDPEHEFGRHLNEAFCLAELGRFEDGRAVFTSIPENAWPESMALHVDEMRAYFEGEPPPRGTIH